VDASAPRKATDFEQFEPERLDLGEHAVERGLVGERTSQRGVVPCVRAWRAGNAARIVSPKRPRTLIW
jgi:hypothetical protein